MTSTTPGTPNSTITQTGATWTVNQFQTSANPATDSSHFVEILTGPKAGMIFDIVSNTATTLTVEGSTSTIGGAQTYCIRKHVMLGALLPGGGGLDAGSDSVSIVNSNGSVSEFVYNGSNWEDVATLDDGTNKVIYPGQGYIISRGSGTNATITVGGNEVSYVKDGPTIVPLYPAQGGVYRNYVGTVNPLVSDTAGTDFTILGNFGLVAGLTAGSDTIDVFSLTGNFATLATYVSNGTNLEDVATLDDGTNTQIRNGTAFRVILGGATPTTITVPQSHP
jgi:hypothetical protein